MKRKKINTHFTLETRVCIEEELNKGATITNIAKKLKRDRSNIGREIEKHKELRLPSDYSNTCCCLKKDNCSIRKYGCQQLSEASDKLCYEKKNIMRSWTIKSFFCGI